MTTNKTNKGRLFSYRKQMIKKNIKQSNHLVKQLLVLPRAHLNDPIIF